MSAKLSNMVRRRKGETDERHKARLVYMAMAPKSGKSAKHGKSARVVGELVGKSNVTISRWAKLGRGWPLDTTLEQEAAAINEITKKYPRFFARIFGQISCRCRVEVHGPGQEDRPEQTITPTEAAESAEAEKLLQTTEAVAEALIKAGSQGDQSTRQATIDALGELIESGTKAYKTSKRVPTGAELSRWMELRLMLQEEERITAAGQVHEAERGVMSVRMQKAREEGTPILDAMIGDLVQQCAIIEVMARDGMVQLFDHSKEELRKDAVAEIKHLARKARNQNAHMTRQRKREKGRLRDIEKAEFVAKYTPGTEDPDEDE